MLPKIDGVVVCEEFAELVTCAFLEREAAKGAAAAERRRREAVSGWLKLLQAVRVRRQLQADYGEGAAAADDGGEGAAGGGRRQQEQEQQQEAGRLGNGGGAGEHGRCCGRVGPGCCWATHRLATPRHMHALLLLAYMRQAADWLDRALLAAQHVRATSPAWPHLCLLLLSKRLRLGCRILSCALAPRPSPRATRPSPLSLPVLAWPPGGGGRPSGTSAADAVRERLLAEAQAAAGGGGGGGADVEEEFF